MTETKHGSDTMTQSTPPITTMTDWSVGLDKQRRPTVTIVLGQEEARRWAEWLFSKGNPNE